MARGSPGRPAATSFGRTGADRRRRERGSSAMPSHHVVGRDPAYSGRIPDPADLAGIELSGRRDESGRCPGHRAVHARHRAGAPPRRSLRPRTGGAGLSRAPVRTQRPVRQSRLGGGRLQRRTEPRRELDRGPQRVALGNTGLRRSHHGPIGRGMGRRRRGTRVVPMPRTPRRPARNPVCNSPPPCGPKCGWGPSARSRRPFAPWGVQLAGNFSKRLALASFSRAKASYAGILGDVRPMIIGTRLRTRGFRAFYRVRVPAASRREADDLCRRIHAAHGACITLRSAA